MCACLKITLNPTQSNQLTYSTAICTQYLHISAIFEGLSHSWLTLNSSFHSTYFPLPCINMYITYLYVTPCNPWIGCRVSRKKPSARKTWGPSLKFMAAVTSAAISRTCPYSSSAGILIVPPPLKTQEHPSEAWKK